MSIITGQIFFFFILHILIVVEVAALISFDNTLDIPNKLFLDETAEPKIRILEGQDKQRNRQEETKDTEGEKNKQKGVETKDSAVKTNRNEVRKPGIRLQRLSSMIINGMFNHCLRKVLIPTKLEESFLTTAEENNKLNLETCGLLTGRVEEGKLVVTHLLIPRQVGKSDSCDATDEEELFDYQFKHNLMALGWIHTHPKFKTFLSSVDLHTHYPYQLMLMEAVAIVHSVSEKKTTVFHLTKIPGMRDLKNCRKKGHHPHPRSSSYYEEAPHVEWVKDASVETVDFRKGTIH